MSYALSQYLSSQGFIANLANGNGLIQSLFPSKAPRIIGFQFADTAIAPCVIESITNPMTTPRADDGNRLYATVRLQLATLTAVDANIWKGFVGSN